MNILITNVSKVRLMDGKPKIENYIDENGNEFEGCMTNEAPIKSIIRRLQKNGESLDRIIYIESDTVRKKDENISGMSHADFLRRLIYGYCENSGYRQAEYSEESDSIRISDEPNAEEVSESVFKVYNRIVGLSQQNDEINIYIESNGGVRYVLSMLLSITETLESRLDNVHIKEISSMVFNTRTSKGQEEKVTRIRNTKSIFDTTQLVGIIDEYVNYGKINSLKKYVESLFENMKDSIIVSDVYNIIAKLSQLSDDIQLCRTAKMLDDFYLNGGIGVVIKRFNKKYEENKTSEIVILKYLLSEIYREYKGVIYDDSEKNDESIKNLPKIIEWCVRKDFIQQAITLCSERIPQYLFASGKIRLSDEYKKEVERVPVKHYEKCYYFIAHLSNPFLTILNAPKQNYISEQIQKIDKGRYLPVIDEKWNIVFEDTKLVCDDRDKVYYSYAVQIYKIIESYMKLKNITKDNIVKLFQQYNIPIHVLGEKVKVSNVYSSSVLDALLGRCYCSKKGDNYTLLEQKSKRIIVSLPQLINYFIRDLVNKKEYDDMIDEVFKDYEELADALKKKFSKSQSEKFYIRAALKTGHIYSDIDDDRLQRILYLYSLCKEQRNLSNHAYVSADDETVAMNSSQISILMRSIIKLC